MKIMISALLISASLVLPACACDTGNPYEIYEEAGLSVPAQHYMYWLMARKSEEEMERLEEGKLTQEEKGLCEKACRAETCSCIVPIDYIGEFKAYAYCTCGRCCDPKWNGLTYMGKTPEEGRTVAVDPAIIPLGTKLLLEYPDGSYRELIAEDTGAGIKGKKLDVFIDDHDRALEHGVQAVKVYIEGGI